jgi:hypothetical protein
MMLTNVPYTSTNISLTPRWLFCPSDGRKLEQEWRHCPQCGAAIPAGQQVTNGTYSVSAGQLAGYQFSNTVK